MSKGLTWQRWPLWRPHGFRISWIDCVVIMTTVALTWSQWAATEGLIAILPITFGHFFLFCNVFRIHRNLELIWASCFMVAAGTWIVLQPLAWWWLLAGMSPITITLITIEIKHERYHGVGSRRRVNKNP